MSMHGLKGMMNILSLIEAQLSLVAALKMMKQMILAQDKTPIIILSLLKIFQMEAPRGT